MSNTNLFIGQTPYKPTQKEGGTGEFINLKGEVFYKIKGFETMDTFLMTIVSPHNHWMFIASNGALTAGRKNPEGALFPYYTDDKIMDSADITGSKTLIKAKQGENTTKLWEPFSERYTGAYAIERNLYKNRIGNKVIFEEINHDLSLSFSYQWTFSEEYGFVKKSAVQNLSDQPVTIDLLDGLQNLMPYGIDSQLQETRSTLADAYKKNELDTDSGIGIFALSSMIVDKAEPSEALAATTVFSLGIDAKLHLLCNRQLNHFRQGAALQNETFTKAIKAAYFINAELNLPAKETKSWYTVAEVNQSTAKVFNLRELLKNPAKLKSNLEADIAKGTRQLKALVGLADGLQRGGEKLSTGRHFSNVLFNIMRGGIFEEQYQINTTELAHHVQITNVDVYQKHQAWLKALPANTNYKSLLALAEKSGDIHLYRICREFLPLSFSRRHGDPSRPWNSFNIDLKDEQGNKKHSFEGNWRDIFQNWEALAYSFPEYIEGIIAKFVNASTLDGYNPYRITNEGIDWEIIEPDDPWSYIGYWGDHQVIYLQKLLEHAQSHYPYLIKQMLAKSNFVYAQVPYRIKAYADVKQNPNDTINFDNQLNTKLEKRFEKIGADGKMVWHNEKLLTANLSEKLLVMSLTKLYNFVPDGGIWLNTQRPEWNDANNALVGNGLSLVTLHYLRRFLVFAQDLFTNSELEKVEVQESVANLLQQVKEIFKTAPQDFSPKQREAFIDAMGKAGNTYRLAAYKDTGRNATTVSVSEIVETFSIAQKLIEKTLRESKRPDGLYHAYNLLRFDAEGAHISYLYEMLEGQVAALSSQTLAPHEVLDLLNALKNSAMFRQNQYSYMLYPNRDLAPFINKNTLPQRYVEQSKLIQKLLATHNTRLVEADVNGQVHFGKHIHNAQDVKAELYKLKNGALAQEAAADEDLLLKAFEELFDHHAFTGRSGTFYGYEGLGSIYWHMVSKLLLAIQENILMAHNNHPDWGILGQILAHFFETRAGIGINKDPKLYGAFPTDAYSHTPFNAGAQQPGLTGQVKEDVLTRWAVLGLHVKNGQIHLNPVIFSKSELLAEPEAFEYVNTKGQLQNMEVKANQMAFTYCNTLFVYEWAQEPTVKISTQEEEDITSNNLQLTAEQSLSIFSRSGAIKKVHLFFPFR
jgi:hypothetical protein